MLFVERKYKLIKMKQNWKWKISHILLQRWVLCFSSFKTRELEVKLWWVEARKRQSVCIFCDVYFLRGKLFYRFCFISMYSVWNKIWEYTYFYKSKTLLHHQKHYSTMIKMTLTHVTFSRMLKEDWQLCSRFFFS